MLRTGRGIPFPKFEIFIVPVEDRNRVLRSVNIAYNVTKMASLAWSGLTRGILHPYLDHSILVASPVEPPMVELVLNLQLDLPNFVVRQILAKFLLSMQAKPLRGAP